jgi:asparagine synthase (glutamine-hydrolysing)
VLAGRAGGEWWLSQWFRRFEALEVADRMMAVDMNSYLPGDILVKVDRMSMACSLEVRAPLLDHELVEFAASLPVSLKVTRRGGKHLLRRYAERLLPPSLVNRKKQGFAIPLDQWFRGDAAQMLLDVMEAERDVVKDLFQRATLVRWLEDHRRGMANHGERLWAILMVLLWHHVVVRRS